MTGCLRPRVVARLDRMTARLEELVAMAQDPELLAHGERSAAVRREIGSLQRVVSRYQLYRKQQAQIAEHRLLIESDPELAEIAAAELPGMERELLAMTSGILDMLLVKEGRGDRNAVMEIRAGTGGEEAALWARDLVGMYTHFADRMHWKIEPISQSVSEMSGFKEIVYSVTGEDVFEFLRFESGGHRVQRVPVTESQGRVHTSAATVAVLLEAEEVEVEIKDADLEFQAVRASGPGGQNVNKVSSAVRLTHRPSGLVVFCQEERSQLKNKHKALKLLRTRLYDQEQQKLSAERAQERRSQVGTGDRNERIRTYNFPQNRVTDHRLHQNFSLDVVLEGKLEPILDALRAADRQLRIEAL